MGLMFLTPLHNPDEQVAVVTNKITTISSDGDHAMITVEGSVEQGFAVDESFEQVVEAYDSFEKLGEM